jgi:hypothetical protein
VEPREQGRHFEEEAVEGVQRAGDQPGRGAPALEEEVGELWGRHGQTAIDGQDLKEKIFYFLKIYKLKFNINKIININPYKVSAAFGYPKT